ncbi:MAG: ABC transporter permease [Fretibacterium sp.]|uniref:nickel ABC transporter permease n=1 Tax=Fretibacterium sp. OH1220_COT-178 TaxID=2491047 RepID=UPI000F5FC2DD|nr:nickel ABC transporter permease [Fretibacterium sp. OH1220_COT-178]MDO4785921.1 ABC transporter permease [Fretibacterium sp.]RRD65121.1 ABC transporter permease [Fretibacterium sp. OH1220_COT-178]
MLRYVLHRTLMLVPVILGVAFIIFTLLYITPGDPARMALGEDAPPEAVEQFRKNHGLDEPFLVQFSRYFYNGFVKGDFGTSYVTKNPVTEELMNRFPITLRLAFYAVLLGVLVGIPFGIICAVRQYSLFDSVTMVLALIGVAMPNFWLGILLILLFSVHLGWLPPSGFTTFDEMVMPVFTLSGGSLAIITRMTRSSMLEVIKADYIRTARAKGQSELKVIFKHALPNALIPIITIIGMQFGALLGGGILTETVFSIPGVGRLMVNSIKMRDYPVVQGGVLYIALVFCLMNLAVDLLYAWVDPRIRAQYR